MQTKSQQRRRGHRARREAIARVEAARYKDGKGKVRAAMAKLRAQL